MRCFAFLPFLWEPGLPAMTTWQPAYLLRMYTNQKCGSWLACDGSLTAYPSPADVHQSKLRERGLLAVVILPTPSLARARRVPAPGLRGNFERGASQSLAIDHDVYRMRACVMFAGGQLADLLGAAEGLAGVCGQGEALEFEDFR